MEPGSLHTKGTVSAPFVTTGGKRTPFGSLRKMPNGMQPIDMAKIRKVHSEGSPKSPLRSGGRFAFLRGASRRKLDVVRPDLPDCVVDSKSPLHIDLLKSSKERVAFSLDQLESDIWKKIESTLFPMLKSKCKAGEFCGTLRVSEGSPRQDKILTELRELDYIRKGLREQWGFLIKYLEDAEFSDDEKPWANRMISGLKDILGNENDSLLELQWKARDFLEVLTNEEREFVGHLFLDGEGLEKAVRITDQSIEKLVEDLIADAFFIVAAEHFLKKEGGFIESIEDSNDPLNKISWNDIRKGLFREGGAIFQHITLIHLDESEVDIVAGELSEKEYLEMLIYTICRSGFEGDEDNNRYLKEHAKRLAGMIIYGSQSIPVEREPIHHVLASLVISAFAEHKKIYRALNPRTNQFGQESYRADSPKALEEVVDGEEPIYLDTRDVKDSSGQTVPICIQVTGPFEFTVSKEQVMNMCPLSRGLQSFRVGKPWATVKKVMTVSAKVLNGAITWERSYKILDFAFAPHVTREDCKRVLKRFQRDYGERERNLEAYRTRPIDRPFESKDPEPKRVEKKKKKKGKRG